MSLVVVNVCSVPETFHFFKGFFGLLSRPGVRVVLAAGGSREVLEAFATEERVAFRHLRLTRGARFWGSIVEAFDMWWWLHGVRPDVVHAHTPKAVLLATFGSALLGIRCRVVHLHGFPADTAGGAKRWALLGADALAMACAHHVIAVGDSIRRKAGRLVPFPAESHIRLLGHGSASGIDTEERFSPERFTTSMRLEEREKLGLPPDSVVICFIGRLAKDKGIDVLAAAWGLVRQSHLDARLVVVGAIDGRTPIAQESLAALRQRGNVVFTGNVPDVERILSVVDVVVLPTLREGLPYVPLEAGSMAVPVITSDIPECAEVVVDGVTGSLVPPRSAEALADAIGRYIRDSSLREAHGRSARQHIRIRFGQGFVRQEILRWYREVIADMERFGHPVI